MSENNQDKAVEVPEFQKFLNDLHTNLLPGMQDGELTFNERDSSGLDASKGAWARAIFSGNELSELVYVRSTEVLDRVFYIHSYTFNPHAVFNQQCVQSTEVLCLNDVISSKNEYVVDSQFVSEEILDFLVDNTKYNVAHSPDQIDLHKSRSFKIAKLSSIIGNKCTVGLQMFYRACTFKGPYRK